jgi:hypothetical protein
MMKGMVLVSHFMNLCRLMRHVRILMTVQEHYPKNLLRHKLTMLLLLFFHFQVSCSSYDT